jgi:hypothetical protein
MAYSKEHAKLTFVHPACRPNVARIVTSRAVRWIGSLPVCTFSVLDVQFTYAVSRFAEAALAADVSERESAVGPGHA